MPYKNLTVAFNEKQRDGFGSQYLKMLSGFAYCEISPVHNYVHTPFQGFDPMHMGPHWADLMNDFIGIPDMRRGKKIHVKKQILVQPLQSPDRFFCSKTQDKILNWYYTNEKPFHCEDVCIHIRRGDLHLRHRRLRDPRCWAHKRMSTNLYYNEKIPKILKLYPDKKITIHTQGKWDEFEPIIDGWSSSMVDAINWKIDDDPRNTFHDFLTCPALFLARSSLSYCAALLKKPDEDIYFQSGEANAQTQTPKSWWKNWNDADIS